VWGGDPACDHEWGDSQERSAGGGQPGEKQRWQHTGQGPSGHPKAAAGSFCVRCNAWLGCLGPEPTPELFVEHIVEVYREVWRVLRPDGTCWVNLGDGYAAGHGGSSTEGAGITIHKARETPANPRERSEVDVASWSNRDATPRRVLPGLKPKDLVGIPWRVAFALQADGWYLRMDVVWHKPNPMPESCRDRPTKAHEYLFLLSKSPRYYYDKEAIKEAMAPASAARYDYAFGGEKSLALIEANKTGIGQRTRVAGMREVDAGRNKRSVWTIPTKSYKGAHFATYPPALVEPCILAGTSARGCCPTCGAPWIRVTRRVRVPTRPGESSKVYKTPDGWDTRVGSGGHGSFHKEGREKGTADYENRHNRDHAEVGNRDPQRHCTETTTLGWRPGCTHYPRAAEWPKLPRRAEIVDHDAYTAATESTWAQRRLLLQLWAPLKTVPCVVLDPFLGSGTTLQVARWHKRHGIGIERKAEYVEMARVRIAAPLHKQPRQKTVKPLAGQLPLFPFP